MGTVGIAVGSLVAVLVFLVRNHQIVDRCLAENWILGSEDVVCRQNLKAENQLKIVVAFRWDKVRKAGSCLAVD